jgi:enterochelin esterase-like enzyme
VATHPLLAMARTLGNPVMEEDSVTYLWQGKSAPLLEDDLHNWEDDPQTMVRAGTELWSCTAGLSSDAYMEYAFIDPKTGTRIPDPLNQDRVANGINAFNNYFYMPGGKPTSLVHTRRGIPRGVVSRHRIPTRDYIVGSTRTVYLYQPPVKEPVPLVVVYDGVEYLKLGKLNLIVDNLIAEKQLRPFAMAFVQSGGQSRNLEYSCSEAMLGFIFDCVISLSQEQLTLLPPGGEPYGVIGASMGGLMALYTGMRLPRVFGRVLSQSGAFILPEHQYVVVDLVRFAPRAPIHIWMDAGRYDMLLDCNRRMHALLKEKKYKVGYNEYPGGHNFTSWRNDIWRGLQSLFK